MTWTDALNLWRRLDGAVLLGVSVYLYLSRRDARRRLASALELARDQVATTQSLIYIARERGIILEDPRQSADEPQSLH